MIEVLFIIIALSVVNSITLSALSDIYVSMQKISALFISELALANIVMATAQGIIEKVALEILALLDDEPKGLRFKEFKSKLKVSEPVVARRLAMLKKYRLVTVMPAIEAETEKQYFAYRITETGKGFISASLSELLTKAREIENTSRKRSR